MFFYICRYLEINFKKYLETKNVMDLFKFMSSIWNPKEELWSKKIDELFDDDSFIDMNNKVKKELGETYLEFAARTGKYQFCKVKIYFTVFFS